MAPVRKRSEHGWVELYDFEAEPAKPKVLYESWIQPTGVMEAHIAAETRVNLLGDRRAAQPGRDKLRSPARSARRR